MIIMVITNHKSLIINHNLFEMNTSTHLFFIRILNFSLILNILNFFIMEPKNILTVFLRFSDFEH